MTYYIKFDVTIDAGSELALEEEEEEEEQKHDRTSASSSSSSSSSHRPRKIKNGSPKRIEREEAREKKAQQLREREKKKLANKKKKAEREAKEREERKRLGLPNPNAPKVSASQPLMLKFFGKKKEDKEVKSGEEEEEEEEKSESLESELEFEFELEDQVIDALHQDTTGQDAAKPEESDVETEFEDDWFDDAVIFEEQLLCENDVHKYVSACTSGISSHAVARREGQATASQGRKPDLSLVNTTNKLCESFEDDTAHLLQELDPSDLQTLENVDQTQRQSCQIQSVANDKSALQTTAQNLKTMPSSRRSSPFVPRNPTPIGTRITTRARARAVASERSESETDDYKENWHPNIPRDGREVRQPPALVAASLRQPSTSQSSPGSVVRRPLEVLSSYEPDSTETDQGAEASADTTEGPKAATTVEEKRGDPTEMDIDQENANDKTKFEVHVDTDDEYGDLNLSTQDLMDIDEMTAPTDR